MARERENVIGLGSLMAIRRWGCSDGSDLWLELLASAKGESTRLFYMLVQIWGRGKKKELLKAVKS